MIRELIKEVLFEYTSKTTDIEIIDLTSILTESEINLLIEGVATIQVPSNINQQVDNHASGISNGSDGYYVTVINPTSKLPVTKKFIITPTKHFKQRLFRTQEPDHQPNETYYCPKLINPGTLEGVNLVFDASEKILDYHFSNPPKSHLIGKEILVRRYVNGVPMSVIIVVGRPKGTNKEKFEIFLKTQIKGVNFRSPNIDKKIEM